MCVEQMVKLNTPVTSSNGEHAIWVDGAKVSHVGPGFPNGSWSGGIFTQNPAGTPFGGLRWRSDANLKINCIWLQNYAPNDPAGFSGEHEIRTRRRGEKLHRLSAASSAPDTTPPSVSMTAPAGGATVSGMTTVSANASDNVGVAGVQFKLDGVNLGAEDVALRTRSPGTPRPRPRAAHTLTAVARDGAGNTRTSASVSVTVVERRRRRAVGMAERAVRTRRHDRSAVECAHRWRLEPAQRRHRPDRVRLDRTAVSREYSGIHLSDRLRRRLCARDAVLSGERKGNLRRHVVEAQQSVARQQQLRQQDSVLPGPEFQHLHDDVRSERRAAMHCEAMRNGRRWAASGSLRTWAMAS